MPRYDDMHRFKCKTHTQHLNFKDLSTQHQVREQSDWTIIKQLASTNPEAEFAKGGSVTLPAPQAVAADTFVIQEHPVETQTCAQVTAAADAPSGMKNKAGVQSKHLQNLHSLTEHTASRPAARAIPSPVEVDYSRLFAPQKDAQSLKAEKEKNQSLKLLFERIASCR